MSAIVVRILAVGSLTESTNEMCQRLERHGWAKHGVATLREAAIVLKTVRFPLVLATEKLGDGSGYELADSAVAQKSTLMVGLKLSETLLWLPVVEEGERSLGRKALNPMTLEIEIEKLLTGLDQQSEKRAGEKTFHGISSGSVLQEAKSMRKTRKRGAELKAPAPRLGSARNVALPPGVAQATETDGKPWRG